MSSKDHALQAIHIAAPTAVVQTLDLDTDGDWVAHLVDSLTWQCSTAIVLAGTSDVSLYWS